MHKIPIFANNKQKCKYGDFFPCLFKEKFMKNFRILNDEGAILNKQELMEHLEKVASFQSVGLKSMKDTYPVPRLIENYLVIKEVYNLLNENIKNKIAIPAAGEWLLDNFYAIEEVVKSIQKDLTLKKYTNFVGISKRKI